jgi:hypothetical protein
MGKPHIFRLNRKPSRHIVREGNFYIGQVSNIFASTAQFNPLFCQLVAEASADILDLVGIGCGKCTDEWHLVGWDAHVEEDLVSFLESLEQILGDHQTP